MLKVRKILDICIQRCLRDGGRSTAWACVIWKKCHKWKVFLRYDHDCREDHTHLISDLWPGSVTEDTQDESTGLRVTEWNWMELFWSDNSTCVQTRKITKWWTVCFIFYHSNRHLQFLFFYFFIFFIFLFFFINRDLYYHYITYNTFTTKFKVTKNYN